ncbi:hypothetical protein BAE44_0010113 [Dichanthelium oligosanthes]|uniref:Protein FAR1-RELATED SEQUENCE n=1 Tax=Dichanthelium oligosanthes TaxID=888268 RepID=A0A1E5VUR4_9POAL|nr:hypothetical protein BAE44_0010113 [Dichanthelium oligosanthes]
MESENQQQVISKTEGGRVNDVDNTMLHENHTEENTITEEDVEIFIENEQETELQIDEKFIPEVGMQFNTSEEAHRFCNDEGTNGVFKKGVEPTYTVMSFLNEYQRITELQIQFTREDRYDYHTRNRNRKVLWSRYYMEKQAHDLYNKAIFVKFQQQLQATTGLATETIENDKMYEVFVDQNQLKQPYRLRKYVVLVNLQEKEYSCLCGKFNKDGILCCHILKIMVDLRIKEIPDKYILDRWRKNEKKIHKQVAVTTPAHEKLIDFCYT